MNLKVDEMWSYEGGKKQPRWLWWPGRRRGEDAVPGEIIGFVEVILTKVSPSTESIKASQNSSDQLDRGLLVGLFDCWDQCLRLVGKHTYGVLSGRL